MHFKEAEGRWRKGRKGRQRGRSGRNDEGEEGEKGEGGEGGETAQSPIWSPISPRRMPLNTLKGLHLDQLANVARTVIPLDPDDESIWRTSCHFIEKLQALLLPLWVKNPRLQQGCLLCYPQAGIEVHEVAGTYGERTLKSHLWPQIPQGALSPGKVKQWATAIVQTTKARTLLGKIKRLFVSKYSVCLHGQNCWSKSQLSTSSFDCLFSQACEMYTSDLRKYRL